MEIDGEIFSWMKVWLRCWLVYLSSFNIYVHFLSEKAQRKSSRINNKWQHWKVLGRPKPPNRPPSIMELQMNSCCCKYSQQLVEHNHDHVVSAQHCCGIWVNSRKEVFKAKRSLNLWRYRQIKACSVSDKLLNQQTPHYLTQHFFLFTKTTSIFHIKYLLIYCVCLIDRPRLYPTLFVDCFHT